MADKPILYGSVTCMPCLEVCDFVGAHQLDIELRWVLPRMDLSTYAKYHVIVASGARVDKLAGIPTLVDGDVVLQGSADIIAHLIYKYKCA